MNKTIAIPIVLYVLSVLVSLFYPIYSAAAPVLFALLLVMILVARKPKGEKLTDEHKENTRLILYSGIALIVGPIFASIFTSLIQ